MECNKEEAFRAKTIAQRKMEANDFEGARKFAMKAQRLYPETENIFQMISVCDVHCSAENNLTSNELDWYGILQVEQTADETLIKRQYRKFALALHPDKNKFSGAESAFKLIGQAQRVLLDKEKRSLYDLKLRTTVKPVMPNVTAQQTSKDFNGTKISRFQNNFMNNTHSNVKGSSMQEQKPQAQPVASNGKDTFWTQCPFCFVRYQYYIEVLTKALKCQSCSKPFIALDMHVSVTRPGPDAATQPVFPHKDASTTRTSKVGSEAVNQKPFSNSKSFSEQTKQFDNRSNNKQEKKEKPSQPSSKENGKRGKKEEVKSSESLKSDSSIEEIKPAGGTSLSSRNKRNVSCSENANDDHEKINPPKRAKGSQSSIPPTESKADASGNCQASNASKLFDTVTFENVTESMKENLVNENGCASDSSLETTPKAIFQEYPDPEFFDFEKDKEGHRFRVGQVWAAYDTFDAMPRFYARVKKVFTSGFKIRMSWLEADPDDEDGKKWADLDLPFSCGKFKSGESIDTEDRLMFSHEVSWERGNGKDSTKIYPRMGQTWALFKNWNAKWYEIPQSERKFEYEYVEVLSEYDVSVGIRVAILGKLKGFASLFSQIDGNEVRIISPVEILRFSHMIPSYRLTGDERKDVPKGSFELDPASVPMRLEENNCEEDVSSKSAEANPSNNGDVLPDTEFCNFDILKSVEKLKVNQVWALYSDIDGLPNYYGLVKKVECNPSLKLQIVWLESCSLPTDMIPWKDIDLPISCGQFIVKAGSVQRYTCNSPFSHQIKVNPTARKNVFTIYPEAGEIWGCYKNWNPEISSLSLVDCEYDIVEVLEKNSSYTKVSILERVPGFNSVFKAKMNGNSRCTREIPRMELLRFSHQIPSFKLTTEREGSLSGYWEVDPAALPANVLAQKPK